MANDLICFQMGKFNHLLEKRMKERGFSVDDQQLAQFGIYCRELRNWSARINLTSLTDDLDVIDKHFIDSLLLLRYENLKCGLRVVDVGTGAGFPGLPIKIYRPDIQLSLVESIGKKARFLEYIVAELELENVDVINDRVEVVARSPEYREQYDLVIARCVARLPTLVEYCLPLVSVGGKFVAYKGNEAEVEVTESEAAIEKLGGRFNRLESDTGKQCAALIDESNRILIFVEKVKETPDIYPRRIGVPKKRPL
jgi:16S rRNA (guanine527-N7)-methyltransferase